MLQHGSDGGDGSGDGTAKRGIRDIPGPTSVPFFGSLWSTCSWLGGEYSGVEYHRASEMRMRRYGPVVRENLFRNFPLVHLFDAGDIRKVLGRPSKYPLR